MTKKKKHKLPLFLETSGVIYELHGDRRMRTAVREATHDGRVWLSSFIRMEYLRGIIFNLIELYFLVKEEDTVHDALVVWAQTKVNQPRKYILILMTISNWITTQDDWESHEKTLRRLGEEIVRLVRSFDELYPRRIKDDLNCELAKAGFPHRAFSENMLLDFYERFRNIRGGVPSCHLCVFKQRQQRAFVRRSIDLCSETQRKTHKKNKGYVKQATRLERALEKDDATPKCRWCEQLGDSIIAVHIRPNRAVLVTADRGFVAFGEILDREIRLLPTAAELKKRETENG